MYLSGRDIRWAIACGKLIVEPRPEDSGGGYDETSIDLHLGPLADARVWDTERLALGAKAAGNPPPDGAPEVHPGTFDWQLLARHQVPIPLRDPKTADAPLVYLRGNEVVVRRFGFLLWPTRERVGTPTIDPSHTGLLC